MSFYISISLFPYDKFPGGGLLWFKKNFMTNKTKTVRKWNSSLKWKSRIINEIHYIYKRHLKMDENQKYSVIFISY